MAERDLVKVENLGPGYYGRRKIFSDKKELNKGNIVTELGKALGVHEANRREIQYLYNVYRGRQDIQDKEKVVRPEINNKVTVNIANEIVTFKTAYFLGSSIQYVAVGGDDDVSKKVNIVNRYMQDEDKDSKDKEICDWMNICGLGIRMVLADDKEYAEGSPATIYTLDPREAFVIYYSGIGQRELAGVIRQRDENGEWYSCVYTKDKYFEVKGDKVTEADHTYGYVPVIEYPNNEARIGSFEIVLPILNAINTLESNRVDNVEDFVNAYDVFQNCEITKSNYEDLTAGGQAIMIKDTTAGSESRVYRISSELNQSGVQTAISDLQDLYIEICGLPNRNGGSSTSDTGVAVTFRDGWADADSRANDTEKMFNRAEKKFLKIFLRICSDSADVDLKLSDIKIEHTRNNLSNMQSRMQILCEGLNNDKIHPKIPWILSGLPNSEEWYRMSMEYYEEKQEEMERSLNEEIKRDENQSLQADGQGDKASEQEGGQTVPADEE